MGIDKKNDLFITHVEIIMGLIDWFYDYTIKVSFFYDADSKVADFQSTAQYQKSTKCELYDSVALSNMGNELVPNKPIRKIKIDSWSLPDDRICRAIVNICAWKGIGDKDRDLFVLDLSGHDVHGKFAKIFYETLLRTETSKFIFSNCSISDDASMPSIQTLCALSGHRKACLRGTK